MSLSCSLMMVEIQNALGNFQPEETFGSDVSLYFLLFKLWHSRWTISTWATIPARAIPRDRAPSPFFLLFSRPHSELQQRSQASKTRRQTITRANPAALARPYDYQPRSTRISVTSLSSLLNPLSSSPFVHFVKWHTASPLRNRLSSRRSNSPSSSSFTPSKVTERSLALRIGISSSFPTVGERLSYCAKNMDIVRALRHRKLWIFFLKR